MNEGLRNCGSQPAEPVCIHGRLQQYRLPAGHAEARAFYQLGVAARTELGQLATAVHAKAGMIRINRLAIRTDHDPLLPMKVE